jgi:hypothetical protein
MNTNIIRNLAAFLAVICILASSQTKAAQPDQKGGWFSYDTNVVSKGIVLYYNFNGSLPSSISELIQGGWVPDNITNFATGDKITGDSPDGTDGGLAIHRLTQTDIELVINIDPNNPFRANFGSDFMMKNETGLPMEQIQKKKLYFWAQACLEGYHYAQGVLPQSVNDLVSTGFWPFAKVVNFYTGSPILANSNDPGDMLWTFHPEAIYVRICTPPPAGTHDAGMYLKYPLP